MNQDVWQYISNFREQGDSYTHISQLYPYQGKFKFERNNMEELWTKYCDAVAYRPELVCSLSEKPGEIQPVRIDIDIKMPKTSDYTNDASLEHLYTMDEVRSVIRAYNKAIKDISKTYKSVNCVSIVLEKQRPYSTITDVKSGFHVHFPRLWARNCDHNLHIIPRVKKILNDSYPGLFSRANFTKTSDAIDEKITSKWWLLYGSCKEVKCGIYKVTKVFDHQANEISLEAALSGDYRLYDTFEKEVSLRPDNMFYMLPRILSIDSAIIGLRNCPVQTMVVKPGLECLAEVKLSIPNVSQRISKNENVNVEEAVNTASVLMTMISLDRAEHHDSWINMGWTLYCIGDGCQEALELWVKFSDRTHRDEPRCIHEWQTMTNTGKFTLGTLHHYAKMDNPVEYEAWKKQKSGSYIKNVLMGGHNDLAKMLYTYYGSSFVYAPIDDRSGRWFEYKQCRWKICPQALSLTSKISNELTSRFQDDSLGIYRNIIEEPDQEDELKNKKKKYDKVIGNLKSNPFKKSILAECKEVFRNEDFLSLLDEDPFLMGFTNGVLDCREMKFREGRPSDYIGKTTGYDYKEFEWSSPEVIDVMDFLDKIFPDPLLRIYFIEYCAQLIPGRNSKKTFVNFVGSGDNGKSIIIELLEHVLGKNQYMIKFPVSLLTGKRTSSAAASPELARSQGVRFAVLQEPSKKEAINDGLLKEITGNDSMFLRGLFKDGSDVMPQYKCALVCNNLPRLGDDQALWNRIEVLPFESCFCKNPKDVPITIEEQFKQKKFPRDESFGDKLPGLKQAFIWIMFQKLIEIKRVGTSERPYKVMCATDEYKRKNDVFLQYRTDRIIETENSTLSLKVLYADFVSWFKELFPNLFKLCPDQLEFKDNLCQKWGQPSGFGIKWTGYKIRSERDDIAEKKAVIMEEKDLGKSADNLEVKLDSILSNDSSMEDVEEPQGERTRLLGSKNRSAVNA